MPDKREWPDHTVPRKTADRLDEFCPKARRRLTVRNRFELKQQLARRHKNMFNEHQKQTPAERKAALQAPDACALKLWQVAFDNLGRHVAHQVPSPGVVAA